MTVELEIEVYLGAQYQRGQSPSGAGGEGRHGFQLVRQETQRDHVPPTHRK